MVMPLVFFFTFWIAYLQLSDAVLSLRSTNGMLLLIIYILPTFASRLCAGLPIQHVCTFLSSGILLHSFFVFFALHLLCFSLKSLPYLHIKCCYQQSSRIAQQCLSASNVKIYIVFDVKFKYSSCWYCRENKKSEELLMGALQRLRKVCMELLYNMFFFSLHIINI